MLAPLATAADLSARGILDNRAALALEVASAAIRDAAGAVISQTTTTLTLRGTGDAFLPLPGPVTAVTSITLDGVAVTDYDVDLDGIRYERGWGTGDIVVTFTHGLSTVPADIVDLTCQLATAWLQHRDAGGGSTAGLTSVRLDDAAETYSDELAGQISPVFVPQLTRQHLRSRFGSGAEVVGFR